MTERIEARTFTHEGYEHLSIGCGKRTIERVVPPAGEHFAFDVVQWSTRIEVAVSPTGRSVQVFINGNKVHPPTTPTIANSSTKGVNDDR